MDNGMANETHRLDFIRSERPRLSALAAKVARVHGGRHPELAELASMVDRLFVELEPHPETDPFEPGRILAGIRKLTSGYRPPDDACNSYLALFQGLERLEADLHEHIHRENNILLSRTASAPRQAKEGDGSPDSCCGVCSVS